MKRIHGEQALHEKYGFKKNPPVPCSFKIGDCVIFTNEYGCKFELQVIGFAESDEFQGRFIHLSSDAPWFAHRPDELRLKGKP